MRSTAIISALTPVLAAALAVSCAKESTPSSSSPADKTPPPAPRASQIAPERGVAAPTQAIGAKSTQAVAISGSGTLAETDEYTLTLAAPREVAVGEAAKVVFTVTPKEGWKLNEEFPPKLKLSPPEGIEIDKPNQGKSDAVSYTTKQASWAVNVKATAAGKKTVSGKLKFAVCTETTCNPRKPVVAFALQAK